MSLLPLLLAVAAAAQAQSPGYPTEAELKTEAASYVEALCKQAQASCAEAKELRTAYEDLLAKAGKCEGGGCNDEEVSSLSVELWLRDKKAAALPPLAGKKNALLRASALCARRLAAAQSKSKQGGGKMLESNVEEKAVEQLCLEKDPACGPAKTLFQGGRKLEAELAPCEKAPCGFPVIDDLARRAHMDLDAALEINSEKVNTLPIFAGVKDREDRLVKVLAVFVDGSAKSFTADNDAFEAKVAAAEKSDAVDVKSLPKDGKAVLARYQEASIAADRLAAVLGRDKVLAQRNAVNVQTTRLTGLRGRAMAVITARGLALDPGTADGFAVIGGQPPDGAKGKLAAAGVNSKAPATLLDARVVPPQISSTPPPEIVSGQPSLPTLLLKSVNGTELEQADAKRRLGNTTTVGSPGLYAGQVYAQADGNTCNIAVQVQILRTRGLLPAGDSAASQEKTLQLEAETKGYKYKDGGTAPEFAGELLISRGLLVSKHFNADWTDLEAAVRRGALLQVSVDARWLWPGLGTAKGTLAHSILLTGAELDKKSGALLGVYINDTGDSPPKGGRFVTTADMKKAYNKNFVEIK